MRMRPPYPAPKAPGVERGVGPVEVAGDQGRMALPPGPILDQNGSMSPSIDRTLMIRNRLTEASARLRDLLEGRRDEAAWAGRFRQALHDLSEAYNDHVDDAEAPGGFFVDLTEADPRLEVEVAVLRQDHTALATRFQGLLGTDPDQDSILSDTAELLLDLEAHESLGADLMYRAFSEDLGGAG